MTVGRIVSTKWAISTEQCGQMMRIATLTKRFAGKVGMWSKVCLRLVSE
jgi:hypothetical protein